MVANVEANDKPGIGLFAGRVYERWQVFCGTHRRAFVWTESCRSEGCG